MADGKEKGGFARRPVRRFIQLFLFCAIYYAISWLVELSEGEWKTSDKPLLRYWQFFLLAVPAVGAAWEAFLRRPASESAAESPGSAKTAPPFGDLAVDSGSVKRPPAFNDGIFYGIVRFVGATICSSIICLIAAAAWETNMSHEKGAVFVLILFFFPICTFGSAAYYNYLRLRRDYPIAAKTNLILLLMAIILNSPCLLFIIWENIF